MTTAYAASTLAVLPQDEQETRAKEILRRFADSAAGASAKVLYELFGHFQTRRTNQTERTITLKGERQLKALPLLGALDGWIVDSACDSIIAALKKKYSKLPPMGRCWLDPKLKNIPLPTNMRSFSESLQVTVRGTRVPLDNPDAKVVRFYVHWKDEKGNIDLDLSSTFVRPDGTVEYLSWCTGYKTEYGCHSGDVRHRIGDCAEYIDIIIEQARKQFQYVLVDVRNYDRRSIAQVAPVFGYMERSFPESNPIWVPKTVNNSFIMTSKSSTTMAIAFDLQTLEYVVLDIDMSGIPAAACNAEANIPLIQKFLEPPKISVYDLLAWHVEARNGVLVEDEQKETAQEKFCFKDFATTYVNTLKWMTAP